MADLADAGVFGERGSAGFACSPDWRAEADRLLDRIKETARLTTPRLKNPRLAGLVRRPRQTALRAAARQRRCALPCFGPGAEFPYAPERKYTPCDASKQQLFALRDHLGFARNVIVQATCHGADNRAMVDACLASGGKARGVATVRRSISDAELQQLHAAGVRGVRFNFVKRLVDFTPKDELMEIAARVPSWAGMWSSTSRPVDLPELWDFFTALPTTVVVDHMGRPT